MSTQKEESFQKIQSGMANLIVTFAGLGHTIHSDLTVFEFRRSLTQMELPVDLLFLKDSKQQWYLGELPGISKTIEETTEFLHKQVNGYDKVIFIGASSGGYASILFGSLLNIDAVIAFYPQTNLDLVQPGVKDHRPIGRIRRPELSGTYQLYKDLSKVISKSTLYYANSLENPYDTGHYMHHFENIRNFQNVTWLGFSPKDGISSGELRKLLAKHLGE